MVARVVLRLIELIYALHFANVVVFALTQQIGSAALSFARVVDSAANAGTTRDRAPTAASDTICRYCRCDASAATVHCVGGHAAMRLRVVRLPEWADTFRAANLTFDSGRLPRFAYHRRLRTIRMNFCRLRSIDAAVFGAVPSLETLDLADNDIDANGVVPLASLSGVARHLRVLNLARNAIEDIGALLDWRINESIGVTDTPWLDELIISGNPLCRVTAPVPTGPADGIEPLVVWPPAGHLALADANLRSINATHFNFGPCKAPTSASDHNVSTPKQSINSTANENRRSGSLSIPPVTKWRRSTRNGSDSGAVTAALFDSIDLSDNDGLAVDGGVDALWHFVNASTLKLRGATLPAVLFTRWLETAPTRLRHLDVSSTRTLPAPLTEWRYCAPRLEWLDLSGMGLRRLQLSATCPIQWLYAEANQIESITLFNNPFSAFGSPLRALHLGNNRLSAWPFPAPSRRTSVARTPPHTDLYAVVDAAAKPPTPPALTLMLDASAFPQLETLSLASNAIGGEIRAEDIGTLPALAHLDLSTNRLDAVFHATENGAETDAAILNPRLEFLNLSGNTIRRLSGRHWPNLPALSVLDLSENRLETFGSTNGDTVNYDKHASSDGSSSRFTASAGAGWYVASAGAWDPYGASGLFVIGKDGWADGKLGRVRDDVNSLLGRLPGLQHLHLARNGRAPAALTQWLDGAGNASNAAVFPLMELDVAECGMPRQPDLSRLSHLTILHMAGNAFPTLDGTRLPPCAVSVDASRNGVERVQGFDDTQLACLRHLRLAENALRCDDADCTLHRLLPAALQQQDDFYDRTEYYCFTDDGWRHPLSAYLNTHATACENYNAGRTVTPDFDAYGSERHHPLYHHYYGGGGRTRHPENAAFHFLGFLLAFIAVTLLTLAVSLRTVRWATRRCRGGITTSTSSAFAYKPMPQSALSDADSRCENDGDGPPIVHL